MILSHSNSTLFIHKFIIYYVGKKVKLFQAKINGKMFVFNPGSIAIPKGGSVRTYGTWEDGTLSVRELANGNVFNGLTMKFL